MTMPPDPRTAKVRVNNAGDGSAAGNAPAADTMPGDTTPPEPTVEKLSNRDLRRARRKARRLGIEAADDHEAARILQERGIDITTRDSVLDIVPGQEGQGDEDTLVQLPAEMIGTAVAKPAHTKLAPVGEAERLSEIATIQRQLIRRRRRRLALLLVKLAFFVALPTFLVGHYYYNTATDMFETSSEFVIQKSDASSANPMGGLFAGTGFATSQDSITVQGYLTSREAMLRLNQDLGFIDHYQQDWIDEIQRLEPDATIEDAFKEYKKRIKVGFDPTEGIIRMQVVAATPTASAEFSAALIGYAEERIDNLSSRVRSDQMAGAQANYASSVEELSLAQSRVLELQERRGVLSADIEVTAQMQLISSLELELETKQLDLAEIQANARPNQARVSVLDADIARLRVRIGELRNSLTQATGDSESLARITGELRVAETDLANRQLMLQNSLQQLETSRIEANRQVRYLSLGVSPVAPDVASYPRKLENTILAFVIFLSIYILISLTVSILREQVSV